MIAVLFHGKSRENNIFYISHGQLYFKRNPQFREVGHCLESRQFVEILLPLVIV